MVVGWRFQGKVYLSPIVDCFDGMVMSWTIGTSPDAEQVNCMRDAAIGKQATDPWCTPTAEGTTAGLAGYRE